MTTINDLYNKYADTKHSPFLDISSEISEPPCKDCEFWKPSASYKADGTFDGLVLCHASEQYTDFSCFTQK